MTFRHSFNSQVHGVSGFSLRAETSPALIPSPTPPASTYFGTANNISGLLAYWDVPSGGTIADQKGARDATIVGSTSSVNGLAANSGGAVRFPNGFPVLKSSVLQQSFPNITTSHVVNLPSSQARTVGDLVAIFFTSQEANSVVVPGGWTAKINALFGTSVTSVGLFIVRKLDGTEADTVDIVTGTARSGVAQVYHISAVSWSGNLADVTVSATPLNTSGSSHDIPAVTAAGNAANLFLAVLHAVDDDILATSSPTDYSSLVTNTSGAGTDEGGSISIARRQLLASSDDPGTMTLSSSESVLGYAVSIAPIAATSASVPHDAGLALAAFTEVIWVRFHAFPVDLTAAAFAGKEAASGLNDGDTTYSITDTGDALLRMQTATASHQIPLGVSLLLETNYCFVLRADGTGFDAYRNGAYLGKNINVTNGWTNNANALEWATSKPFMSNASVTIGPRLIYNRVLTEAEILTLSQQTTQQPVAASFSVSINESSIDAPIDALPQCIFVGTPTLAVLNKTAITGAGDDVTVGGSGLSQVFLYDSAAVSADRTQAFTYTLTDNNGSDTGTIEVTVIDTAAPVLSNSNCYVVPGAQEPVSSMAALETAIDNASPGDDIRIASGTYTGGTRTLTPAGTEANPITVRPAGSFGSVTINSLNWTFGSGAQWCTLSNLYLNSPRFDFNSNTDHLRLSRIRWRQLNRTAVEPNGRDLRIDHGDWTDSNYTTHPKLIFIDPDNVRNRTLRRLLLDHHYVHDMNGADAPNGWLWMEFVLFADGDIDCEIVVDTCYIRNTNWSNTAHLIYNKQSHLVMRYCTLENCGDYLEQRGPSGLEIRSCWLENIVNTKMFDQELYQSGLGFAPLFIGNYSNRDVWVPAGNDGDPDFAPNGNGVFGDIAYHACCNGQFLANTFAAGVNFRLGIQYSGMNFLKAAQDNNFYRNNRQGTSGDGNDNDVITYSNQAVKDTGTTFTNPGLSAKTVRSDVSGVYDYIPAVKLPVPAGNSADKVGPHASDLFCPSGPQTAQ